MNKLLNITTSITLLTLITFTETSGGMTTSNTFLWIFLGILIAIIGLIAIYFIYIAIKKSIKRNKHD